MALIEGDDGGAGFLEQPRDRAGARRDVEGDITPPGIHLAHH